MSDEAQVFRGDRPVEESDAGMGAPAKAKAQPAAPIAKNDLPAGEPVGDAVEDAAAVPTDTAAQATTELAQTAELTAPPPPAEPEPEYNFEIDPDSLWSMPAAMQERLSNLASASSVTHQILDELERDTARIAKALKALR